MAGDDRPVPAVREGNQPAAVRLLHSSQNSDVVIGGLLTMLGMFLRAEDPVKLDQLIAAFPPRRPTAHLWSPPFPPADS